MKYLITTSFLINAKDDGDAAYKAKYIAARLDKSYHSYKVISIDEVDFGAIPIKGVYSLKNKEE